VGHDLEAGVGGCATAGESASGTPRVATSELDAVALRVREGACRADVGAAEVARLVGSDAGLAAQRLRCANAASHRAGEPVANLRQAVTRIGHRQVLRLALASSLAGHAQAPGPLAEVRRVVWMEGLAGAPLCQELAHLRRLGGRRPARCSGAG